MNFAVKRKTFTEDTIMLNFDGMKGDANGGGNNNFMHTNQTMQYEGGRNDMQNDNMQRPPNDQFMNNNMPPNDGENFQDMRNDMQPTDGNNNFIPHPSNQKDFKGMMRDGMNRMNAPPDNFPFRPQNAPMDRGNEMPRGPHMPSKNFNRRNDQSIEYVSQPPSVHQPRNNNGQYGRPNQGMDYGPHAPQGMNPNNRNQNGNYFAKQGPPFDYPPPQGPHGPSSQPNQFNNNFDNFPRPNMGNDFGPSGPSGPPGMQGSANGMKGKSNLSSVIKRLRQERLKQDNPENDDIKIVEEKPPEVSEIGGDGMRRKIPYGGPNNYNNNMENPDTYGMRL